MTVAELIAKLQECDPNAQVHIGFDVWLGASGNESAPATHVVAELNGKVYVADEYWQSGAWRNDIPMWKEI